VLIEAMACGKPVVTTRHVEIPRIVEQILVDENDVHGLADALERVYQSPALRRELGRRNRVLAEEYFSARNVGETANLLIGMSGVGSDVSPLTVAIEKKAGESAHIPEILPQLEHIV
jgi:glycosyltransferase involved in cell wall biosynthesis